MKKLVNKDQELLNSVADEYMIINTGNYIRNYRKLRELSASVYKEIEKILKKKEYDIDDNEKLADDCFNFIMLEMINSLENLDV